jgi:hypothetical protein
MFAVSDHQSAVSTQEKGPHWLTGGMAVEQSQWHHQGYYVRASLKFNVEDYELSSSLQ